MVDAAVQQSFSLARILSTEVRKSCWMSRLGLVVIAVWNYLIGNDVHVNVWGL